MRILESHVCGSWQAPDADGVVTNHAVTGEPVASVSSTGVDLRPPSTTPAPSADPPSGP